MEAMIRRTALAVAAAALAASGSARVQCAASASERSRAEISVRLRGSPSASFDAGWRIEERLGVRTRGGGLSLSMERDPGERRWADHWSATLTAGGRKGRPEFFVGNLALRAPGLAFSARGADARPVRLSPPSPPRVSAWESAAEFGAVRGAGVTVPGRRLTVAAAAGWTPLDVLQAEDGAPSLARDGNHAPGSRVRANAAVEQALFMSAWLGRWPRGVGVTVFAADYKPAFAPAACGPRRGVRADATAGWRAGDTAAWASVGADARGRDAAAGWRRTARRASFATAFAYSDGECPCGARRPRPAAGKAGGVEALQGVSWNPRRSLWTRLEWEARASGGGGRQSALRAEVRHGAGKADEVSWTASLRPSSRRATVVWRRWLTAGTRALVSASRGASGAGSSGRLGLGIEGSRGAFRWGVSANAAADGPSPGGGGSVIALPREGAVSGAFLAIRTESWGIVARTASAWRPDGRGATGIALGFSHSLGWNGPQGL
jgi:hypothetical protein